MGSWTNIPSPPEIGTEDHHWCPPIASHFSEYCEIYRDISLTVLFPEHERPLELGQVLLAPHVPGCAQAGLLPATVSPDHCLRLRCTRAMLGQQWSISNPAGHRDEAVLFPKLHRVDNTKFLLKQFGLSTRINIHSALVSSLRYCRGPTVHCPLCNVWLLCRQITCSLEIRTNNRTVTSYNIQS